MSHPSTSAQDAESLRHRICFLELLAEEYKLKARRMALHAAHCERMLRLATRKEAGHD